MPVNANNTWVGFGATIGGMLAIAGVESMVGLLMRADAAAHCDVNATSARLGLGLGGSGGGAILAAVNCPDLTYFRNHPRTGGFGMALALPTIRFTIPPSLARVVGELPVMAGTARQMALLQRTRQHVESLFNFVQAIMSADELRGSVGSGTPGFHIIGLPGLGGGGMEGSIFVTRGFIELGDERATRRGMVR